VTVSFSIRILLHRVANPIRPRAENWTITRTTNIRLVTFLYRPTYIAKHCFWLWRMFKSINMATARTNTTARPSIHGLDLKARYRPYSWKLAFFPDIILTTNYCVSKDSLSWNAFIQKGNIPQLYHSISQLFLSQSERTIWVQISLKCLKRRKNKHPSP
jgi:hypothetical protein